MRLVIIVRDIINVTVAMLSWYKVSPLLSWYCFMKFHLVHISFSIYKV